MTTSADKLRLFSQFASPLFQLSSLVIEESNEKMVYQIKGLMERLQEQNLYIAFCGHYSAGKSSLLNKMFSKNILPSSPIPTSANTVKLSAGQKERAIIEYRNGTNVEQSPLDFDEVKKLCKNGEEVQQVEIQTPYPTHLPSNLVFFDTPGIDSTDDAHQMATESMLHLADLVFYMVDYHHVQSDINLQFIKQLNKQGKRVCLIVNQIDKHVEEEIRFVDFKESTINAFADSGAVLEHVFFTSVKDEAHHCNDWRLLQSYLESLSVEKDDWLHHSYSQMIAQLTRDWEQFVEAQFSENMAELQEKLSGQSFDQLQDENENLHQQLMKLDSQIEQVKQDFNSDLAKMLHNSYLMDFKTRELAKAFLESQQEGFKVGLLFSKKKTAEEQSQRENAFYEKLKEQIQSQFEWHLKQLAQVTAEKLLPEDSNLMVMAQALHCEFPKSLIVSTYKSGASLSGQYVLQYSNDLENEVKKIVQKEARKFLDELQLKLTQKNQQQKQTIEDTIKRIESEKSWLQELEEYQEQKSKLLWKWQEKVQESMVLTEQAWQEQIQKLHEWLILNQNPHKVVQEKEQASSPGHSIDEKEDAIEVMENQDRKDDSHLHEIAESFSQIPALKSIADSVYTKATRLDTHAFTVTLFGAFSAGKSSFINGLLGTKLLPSSPNPMTAALTEIKSANETFEDHSLQIHYKTELEMIEELKDLIKHDSTDIEEVWKHLNGLENNKQHPFLEAFVTGYSNAKEKLGKQEKSTLHDLTYYATEESVSCFIKKIEVFIDHPLTNAGMTLVDTPGSDSLNTRHTGVAFEHIKNSDAIIYVTYYHHAFGKADREFLIQLGRVKDSFSLDKMFFIVNAADLADTEEERTSVVDYVKDQLQGYGLRHPRLFPVSSVNRLSNQMSFDENQWDGFDKFESSFRPFVEQDLKQVTRQSAWKEVGRGLEILQSFIDLQSKSEQEKDSIKQEYKDKEAIILEKFKHVKTDLYRNRLEQEADELVHYVKKRVALRTRDFFKESFNPSRLQGGSGVIKEQLQLSLSEWIALIEFDLIQELRATSLRLENFVNKLVQSFYKEISEDIRQILAIPFSEPHNIKRETPDILSIQSELNNVSFQPALQLFKNAKAFFEKNDKEKMLKKLEEIMELPLTVYTQNQSKELADLYGDLLIKEIEQINRQLESEVNEFMEGQISALSSGEEAKTYEMIVEKVNQLI